MILEVCHVPYIEPLVGLNVRDIVLVAQLLWRNSLLQCLRLRRRPVLICATYVKCSPISRPVVPAQISLKLHLDVGGTHRLKTSALSVLPIILPRWGTLLQ